MNTPGQVRKVALILGLICSKRLRIVARAVLFMKFATKAPFVNPVTNALHLMASPHARRGIVLALIITVCAMATVKSVSVNLARMPKAQNIWSANATAINIITANLLPRVRGKVAKTTVAHGTPNADARAVLTGYPIGTIACAAPKKHVSIAPQERKFTPACRNLF